jgi:phage shock protein A
VRTKIEARYAKAKAVAELNESTVDASIREIEEATANAAAQDRLSELRDELGIGPTKELDGSPAAAPAGLDAGPPPPP